MWLYKSTTYSLSNSRDLLIQQGYQTFVESGKRQMSSKNTSQNITYDSEWNNFWRLQVKVSKHQLSIGLTFYNSIESLTW